MLRIKSFYLIEEHDGRHPDWCVHYRELIYGYEKKKKANDSQIYNTAQDLFLKLELTKIKRIFFIVKSKKKEIFLSKLKRFNDSLGV